MRGGKVTRSAGNFSLRHLVPGVMILITGATGNVGRPLIARLLREGAEVRAISRDPGAANLPPEVHLVQGNPTKPDTIMGAMSGCSALFVNPIAVGTSAQRLLGLAAEHGIRKVVVLSASNTEDEDSVQPSRCLGHYNREVEQAAMGSGLAWTSLRPSVYASNMRLLAGQIAEGDVIRGPYPASSDVLVDPRDIAEVGARALLCDDLLGERLVITGPHRLTQKQVVATIGDAIGRPLRYAEESPEQAAARMRGFGAPEHLITANLARLAWTIARPPVPTDDVRHVLGRPATTFATWVADHADLFRPREHVSQVRSMD